MKRLTIAAVLCVGLALSAGCRSSRAVSGCSTCSPTPTPYGSPYGSVAPQTYPSYPSTTTPGAAPLYSPGTSY